jgi:hypothetical protein
MKATQPCGGSIRRDSATPPPTPLQPKQHSGTGVPARAAVPTRTVEPLSQEGTMRSHFFRAVLILSLCCPLAAPASAFKRAQVGEPLPMVSVEVLDQGMTSPCVTCDWREGDRGRVLGVLEPAQ